MNHAMSKDQSLAEIQTLLAQYQGYYEQRLASGEPCWNDAVFRMETEQSWLDTKVHGNTYREIIEEILARESLAEWLPYIQTQLEQGETLLVYIVRFCADQDPVRMRRILTQHLPEELLFWDWDAPCNRARMQEMEQFAEVVQLMECVFPEEFADFCLQWLPKVPLENEYIPELLFKGLVHTAEETLPELLQNETFHNGLKIGLLNYICQSPVRQEAIYTILKSMFKQTKDAEEKHFLGILLGEYGDSRAIPVLRKYLEFLIQTEPAQREALREIASAIYKLGGQYEDLMHI